jgi:hypothetical protein
LKPDNLNIHVYVDASYAPHEDAKSHTGLIITLGLNGGPVHTESKKQKIVTTSSTEAELVALHSSLGPAEFVRDLVIEQGYTTLPIKLFQDNKSTICLASKGESNNMKTKHIKVRYYYVKQLLENKVVTIEHLGTEDMIADIFTKPLVGRLFFRLRALLMNIPMDSEFFDPYPQDYVETKQKRRR